MKSGKSENFAFSSSSHDARKEFLNLTASFLEAKTYHEAEHRARQLMLFILTHHDKAQAMAPVLENLNLFELYGNYNFVKQRLHYCHQINVFLLGLYIYHNFEPLRKNITLEMQKTTPEIKIEGCFCPFRYSGGNEYGEFLYRWRLASLCHDIGTGISLCERDSSRIAEYLEQIPFEKKVASVDELSKIGNHDLLQELDAACDEVSLSDYMKYQNSHPFPDSVYYDHGIISALIFLRLMHEEYGRHGDKTTSHTRFGCVFWHPKILSNSILQIAIAIAMHNLEKHPQALQMSAKNIKIFDMNRRPLAWLLKIADLLQEWDKPRAKNATQKLPVTNLKLEISDSKISVENFPNEKRKETLEFLRRYTSPEDIVSI